MMGCMYAALGQQLAMHTEHLLSGRAQGTTYSIKYYADVAVSKQDIDSIIAEIDSSMSLYHANSIISRFNAGRLADADLDSHIKNVLDASFSMNKLSNGYFDITVLPLSQVWGFGPDGSPKNLEQQCMDSIRAFVGMDKLRWDGEVLQKLDPRITIDLNGIAQGYTVDVLADYLEQRGIAHYLVELGGEIRTKGHKPSGSFVVAVNRPPGMQNGDAHWVKLSDCAITTSGSYENQRCIDETMISHHMDPFTGKPLASSTVSVTVIAKTAMEADGLDNFFMYLKPAEAISYAEGLKDVDIYLVYLDGNTYKELQTKGFKKYLY